MDSLIVIGGGIVGLSTAYAYSNRFPGAPVTVLEKEREPALHQTGRNSGVIHSGIYYKPGSLKAQNCRRGLEMLERFATEHEIAWEKCGKVIVAVNEAEAGRLENILERGKANGVTCRLIDRAELTEYEPHVAGMKAIRVEDTGIIDYVGVCHALVRCIEKAGGRVEYGAEVTAVKRENAESGGVVIQTKAGEFRGDRLVSCCGLHADRVARLAGADPSAQIVPFRGEYFELKPEARHLCKHLIYPVPDPAFPFLGVHFTRMVKRDEHGYEVECGPNAVLALAREGYTKTTVNLHDLAETLTYPAFWKIALKYWKTGAGEMHRSFSKAAFTRALQRLMPDITANDLVEAPAGVRAQALGRDGALLDDFAITEHDRVVHVINAPSPAATASLSIGELIIDRVERQMGVRGRPGEKAGEAGADAGGADQSAA